MRWWRPVFLTPTARSSVMVFTGNLLNALGTFLAFTLVARTLSVAHLGNFSIAFALIGLVSALSDLGLGAGVVRAATHLEAADQPELLPYLFGVALKARLVIGGGLVGLGLVAAHPIADFLDRPDLSQSLVLATVGAGVMILLNFLLVSLWARQRFLPYAVIATSIGLARSLAMVGLVLFSSVTVSSATAAFALAPLVVLLGGWYLIPPIRLGRLPEDFLATRQLLWQFSLWVTVALLLTSLINRIDLLMLAKLAAPEAVAEFSVASQFTLPFALVVGSLTTVLLPQGEGTTTIEAARRFLGRTLRPIGLLAAASTLSLVIGPVLLVVIFGSRYETAVPVLWLLLFAHIVSLVVTPFSLLYYLLDRPVVLTIMNAIQAVIVVIGNLWAIPRWGAAGAGLTFCLASLVGGLWLLLASRPYWKGRTT